MDGASGPARSYAPPRLRRQPHDPSLAVSPIKAEFLDINWPGERLRNSARLGRLPRFLLPLGALFLSLCVVIVAWVSIDRHPPEWDHANHLKRAVDCYGILSEPGHDRLRESLDALLPSILPSRPVRRASCTSSSRSFR